MNRRQFLEFGSAAALGFGATLLSACSAEPTPVPDDSVAISAPTRAPATAAPQPTAAENVEPAITKTRLKTGYPFGDWRFGCNAVSALHDTFVKTHPDIGVNKPVCTYPFDATIDSVKATDDLDVFFWPYGSTIEPARRGLAMPLDDLFRINTEIKPETWHASLLANNRYDGKLYGLPTAANVTSLMINDVLFKDAGLPLERAKFPTRWDELRKLSTPLVRFDGDRLDRAGYVPDPISMGLPQLALCAGAGGIFDPDRKQFSLGNDALADLLAFFVDWLKTDYKADARLLGLRSTRFVRGVDAIESGSMLWGSFYEFSSASVNAQQFTPMAYPTLTGVGSAAGAYGHAYSIFPASKNREAAFAFIADLAARPSEAFAVLGDVLPARIANDQPIVVKKLRAMRGSAFADDFSNFYQGELKQALPILDFPISATVTAAAEPALRDIMAGKTGVKAGLAALEQTLNEALLK